MRSVNTRWVIAILALFLLNGCVDDEDEGAVNGESETGDPGTDLIDPADGDGAVPTGRPDRNDQWVSPSSLGNGLVHDTRSAVDPSIHTAQFTRGELVVGAAWTSFVDSNTKMLERGFRPAQIDATVELTDNLEILDNSLYISDDDANFRTEIFTHAFDTPVLERQFAGWPPVALGARPTSIQTFAGKDYVGYAVAWVYDSATKVPTVPWVMKVGQTQAQLVALLADSSHRPISLSSRRRAGASEYAVILVPTDSPANWSASVDVRTSTLADQISKQWKAGFYPFRITAEQGDSTRVNILWAMRPPGISVQPRLNLTEPAFEKEDAWWRSHGYHLETVETYVEGGEQRRAAVWVRYEPYLRWQGTEFVPGDASYAGKYKMFHDQVLRVMGNFTEIDCGNGQACPQGDSCHVCTAEHPCFQEDVCVGAAFGKYTRPSATLHIFEGDQLVLNRAYTFAPAVYEDTPLNASMKLASVSKSITAAAVVRELAVQGEDANMSFAEAAKITPTYPLEGTLGPFATWAVRVRDALQHQGGFAGDGKDPLSYLGHSRIVAAGATVPVNGAELYEYVFAPPPDGHVSLGEMNKDTYWESKWFITDLISGRMRYSNAAYSLLGQVVRILSGIPYEEYVTSKILTPLGLQDRIYPDPGLRARTRGPTLASRGNYLVDTSHPYNVDSLNPEQPRVGLAANPSEEQWRPYMGPNDPRAPMDATQRYGGHFYLGGAPLAAGGWWGNGEALGHLIRTLSRTDSLLPQTEAIWLWYPDYWNFKGSPVPPWAYAHGWYVRGNWVAWMGGDRGAVALTMYNRVYDVTVVFLANGSDTPSNFINPLMRSPNLVPGLSQIGQVWPCIPDPSFGPKKFSTCNLPEAAVY